MKTQLKSQARAIRELLAHHHHHLGLRHSLEVLAAMYGLPDWNTLCARPDTTLQGPGPASTAARDRLRQFGLHTSQELCEVMYHQIYLTRAIIGPPSTGKRTLLKDIIRIRITGSIAVVDTSSEISGDGTRHPLTHRVRKWPGY